MNKYAVTFETTILVRAEDEHQAVLVATQQVRSDASLLKVENMGVNIEIADTFQSKLLK